MGGEKGLSMAHFNAETQELAIKLVYYGPACSGKTQNIRILHEKMAAPLKQQLLTLNTGSERTLYFDYLLVTMGMVGNIRVRCLVYTVPGQVFYHEARRHVLRDVDGVVFVVDSDRKRLAENLACLVDLKHNLAAIDRSFEAIPLVLQYNKRDLEGRSTIEELSRAMNPDGSLAWQEAIAHQGIGVVETFKELYRMTLGDIMKQSPVKAESAHRSP